MNLIFCVRERDFTKICSRENSVTSKSKLLLQSDEVFIDCITIENKLLCLNSTGILFIYDIVSDDISNKNIKLFFNNKLQLPYNETNYPVWITKYKETIYSGNSNSLLHIKIISDTEYTIKIIDMKKVYNSFFVHLNEICCVNMQKCIDTNYKIISSAISTAGTHYFISSKDCSFILNFDNKAIACKQIEKRNVIKIEEFDNNIYSVIRTSKGFYLSKINESHGLITKDIVEIETEFPILCACIIN